MAGQSKRLQRPGVRTDRSRPATALRQLRPTILIVCEGKKTEPQYFRQFRVASKVHGVGLDTMRVVEEAQRINDLDGPFDQVWCVFDKDSFPDEDFDNAIAKINSLKKKGFRVAYSNECFELWYLLHFEFLQSALTRNQYGPKLDIHLGEKYLKNDVNIYNKLRKLGDESLAIKRADRLLHIHQVDDPCSKRCPSTTVHELVRLLRSVHD